MVFKATLMKILASHLLPFALLAAGALFLPALGRADMPAPAASPAPSVQGDPAGPPLSFDFPGGSLSDLITLIGKANGGLPLNVIGEKNAMATEVQAFTVRNAYRDAILRAVGELLHAQGVRVAQIDRGVFIVSNETPKEHRSGPLSAEEAKLLRQTRTSFDSFQLAAYLDDQQTVDNIVDVIRSAWAMNPDHDANALQLKFHPATKLLLVSGPPEALQMTGEVIRSLHANRKVLRGDPPAASATK
jgi:hypothetical protein